VYSSQLKIAAEDYKNEKTLGHQVKHFWVKKEGFKGLAGFGLS